MSRWKVFEDADKLRVMPTSMTMGYAAVVSEHPNTPEGKTAAEAVIQLLDREYVAGMKEAQANARHALALTLGLDETKLEELQDEFG